MAAVLAMGAETSLTAVANPWPASSDDPWQRMRAVVLAHINAARTAHGVAPLAHHELLTRLGDRHGHDLIADGVVGHFSTSGTPPYLRYLLAGGTGYHRQNVAALVSSTSLAESEILEALLASVERMLAEQPPADGHRATLLDPTSTHIGIGIAARGGWLVSTHEVAVQIARIITLPPVVAPPGITVRYAAALPPPWRAQAAELMWEPLPAPLTVAHANALTSYSYPPRGEITYLQRERRGALAAGSPPLASVGWTVDRRGEFSLTWTTGPREGVEIILVWASTAARQELAAVAAAAVVVTRDGTLPPELGRWVELRGVGRDPS
ncbi:MAG: CAP domain-containing protein [Acidobacteriota bacterium]|jgi:uncharacterized protein YkwD